MMSLPRRVLPALYVLATIIGSGVAGYMVIEHWSFIDALYMTILTITTVGYGEVHTLSQTGKVFSVVLMIGGVGGALYTLSLFIQYLLEGQFGINLRRRRMKTEIAKLKEHFILCGYGRMGQEIAHTFNDEGIPFVVIENSQESAARAGEDGYLCLQGDATNDEVLKSAGIERARGIIAALGNDADNLYICLTARSLNSKLRIISRVVENASIDKLKKAGADYVFSPEKIGGIHLASAALRPTVMSFLDTIMRGQHLNLLLDEVVVQQNSALAGKTLKEAEISKNIGIVIPAIKSADPGKLTFNPSSDSVIHPGDTLIGFGNPEQLKQLRKMCS